MGAVSGKKRKPRFPIIKSTPPTITKSPGCFILIASTGISRPEGMPIVAYMATVMPAVAASKPEMSCSISGNQASIEYPERAEQAKATTIAQALSDRHKELGFQLNPQVFGL